MQYLMYVQPSMTLGERLRWIVPTLEQLIEPYRAIFQDRPKREAAIQIAVTTLGRWFSDVR